MNIRSVSNPAVIVAKDKIEAERTIKSEVTDERESFQQDPRNGSNSFRPLTPEEVEKVVEKLKSHEGVQRHNFQVVPTFENGQNIVKILSPDGQVLRRFIEQDLYHYLHSSPLDNSLQLVKKSA